MRNFQQHWKRHDPIDSPTGESFAYVAHNSYFQIWAEGGSIAFAVYLILLGSVFFACRRLRIWSRQHLGLEWASHYARLFEATIVGFMVGAFFLNRGHFDLTYHFFSLVTCAMLVAKKEILAVPAAAAQPAAERSGVEIRWRLPGGSSLMPRWGR
jgi:O-antigen ligase